MTHNEHKLKVGCGTCRPGCVGETAVVLVSNSLSKIAVPEAAKLHVETRTLPVIICSTTRPTLHSPVHAPGWGLQYHVKPRQLHFNLKKYRTCPYLRSKLTCLLTLHSPEPPLSEAQYVTLHHNDAFHRPPTDNECQPTVPHIQQHGLSPWPFKATASVLSQHRAASSCPKESSL